MYTHRQVWRTPLSIQISTKHLFIDVHQLEDEKEGVVMCLSQAKDSASVINTHKEAHGLIPAMYWKLNPANNI